MSIAKHYRLDDTVPHADCAVRGYKYAVAIYRRYLEINPLDCEDVLMAAVERVVSDVAKGVTDRERLFRNAQYSALREFRKLYCRVPIATSLFAPDPVKVSLLSIARVIYAGLKKKGARGRKSAAIKAFILREVMNGGLERREFENKTTHGKKTNRYHIIALRSQTLNVRHHLTKANATKHYQSATALLFGVNRGNINR